MSAALRWNCGVKNRTGVRSGCCRRLLGVLRVLMQTMKRRALSRVVRILKVSSSTRFYL